MVHCELHLQQDHLQKVLLLVDQVQLRPSCCPGYGTRHLGHRDFLCEVSRLHAELQDLL